MRAADPDMETANAIAIDIRALFPTIFIFAWDGSP